MESIKCALCLNKCTPGIKIAENVLNSKGIVTISRGDKDIPLRNQLQIILLFRKILEVPQEKCCDFLRDYGDPCSWINCCNSCSTLVGECRIIFDQIMKLQKQFEHLQEEIKNIIIRSATSVEAKDEFHWGGGVQREMRSYIAKDVYQVNPIKEECVGNLPCLNITINNETVNESILGCFPEEIGDYELQQNTLIAEENVSFQTNSMLNKAENCDSEEQDPLQELNEGDDSDTQQDIQNAKVMSEGGYFQSKSSTLGIPFFSHLTEYVPENSSSTTSSNASIYTEDKTFQCNICGKRFSELANLHDHFCTPTANKPFKNINGSFSTSRNHSEENCYICIQGFNDSKDLNDHIISTQSTNNPQTIYKCEFCGKCFLKINALEIHNIIHTAEKSFKCRFCEESFTHSNHLKYHERIHTGAKKKLFKCQFCEKSFSQSNHLEDHERMHTGEKPFKCQVCEKSFFRSGSLTTHERIHYGDKPYRCKFCVENFTAISDLKTHERIHIRDKPYKCGFCEKRFSLSRSLKVHERIHTGERPFECKFCEKSFTRSEALVNHERTHTGEKPWECKFCKKRFSLSNSFRIHERNCTGYRSFE